MSSTGHFITHVSDTARWTALHRATESALPDALFSDPLAEHLAGEHGRAIVARVPWLPQSDPRHPGRRPWSAALLAR